MNLKEFIQFALLEVEAGLKATNDVDNTSHFGLEYPIELDLAITTTKYGIEVIDFHTEVSRDVTRLKIKFYKYKYFIPIKKE